MLVDLSVLSVAVTVFTFLYYAVWCLLAAFHVSVRDKTYGFVRFNPHPPKVTVLLPCRDEEAVVAESIKQCLNQSYRNLEIVVVAHNCLDNTYEIAKRLKSEKVRVVRLETEEAGKGLGLNYGLQFATGEIIVYFDADSIIERDYVQRIVQAIYGGKLDVVQGKIVGANSSLNQLCFLQHMENLIFLSFFWGGKQKLGLSSGLGGTGIGIKRSALERIGGFRNVLIEDFDLCLRAELEGLKVGYCRDAVVRDEKVPRLGMMMRQRSRWVAGHFQLIKGLIKKPRKVLKLLLRNPVDLLHLFSPFYSFALWLGVFLGVGSFVVNSLSFFSEVWVVFFSFPLGVFIVETALLQILFVLVLRKECRSRDEFRRCMKSLPLFYFFTLHWLVAFWGGFFLRDWQRTKTQHGFRTRVN